MTPEEKIKELELELTVEKDQHQEETNLHIHAEDYIKSLEQQIEKMKCFMNCDYSTHPSPNDCPVLNEKKKTDCKGCKYWRLRNE